MKAGNFVGSVSGRVNAVNANRPRQRERAPQTSRNHLEESDSSDLNTFPHTSTDISIEASKEDGKGIVIVDGG